MSRILISWFGLNYVFPTIKWYFFPIGILLYCFYRNVVFHQNLCFFFVISETTHNFNCNVELFK